MNEVHLYIATNPAHTAFYIGITNDLRRRMNEHRNRYGADQSFVGKYHTFCVVYHEGYPDRKSARAREVQLKKWSRKKKMDLIRRVNPHFKVLYPHHI